MLSTIARMGKVISLFTPARPEWGVREAATALGVPRSNAHTLLSSLADLGLLQRTDRGRYRLGWRLLTISSSLIASAGFQQDAVPVLRQLVAKLGETANLGVWDGHSAVRLASIRGRLPHSPPASGMGTRAAGHATALGRALLAARDDTEISALLARWGLPRLTPHTNRNIDQFWAEIERVRAGAVARSSEESTPGVACVGTVVRDSDATVVAAVSVSVPVARFTTLGDRYASAVREAAGRISQHLTAASKISA